MQSLAEGYNDLDEGLKGREGENNNNNPKTR